MSILKTLMKIMNNVSNHMPDNIRTSSLEGIHKGNVEQEEAVKGDIVLKIAEHRKDPSSALHPHLNPVLLLQRIELPPNTSNKLAVFAVKQT